MRPEDLLNGNPAMLEIWFDAMNRIEAGIELAPVQTVVLREWSYKAQSRLSAVQLKSQNTFCTDEEYAEMAALQVSLEKFRPYI